MKLNNREVEVNDVCCQGVDSYYLSATYLDTGKELDDNELDQLTNENPEDLDERCFERNIMRAESAYEGDR